MLRHTLVEIVTKQKLRSIDVEGSVITIAEVSISPDMKKATAYCSAFGNQNTDDLVKKLNQAAKEIRHHLAKSVALKYTPEIIFREDQTIAQASAVDSLLNTPRVARDLGQITSSSTNSDDNS